MDRQELTLMTSDVIEQMAKADGIELRVNGKDERLAVSTVADLLGAVGLDATRKGIAVALNGAVVSRRAWAETALASGDAVEIIHAKQGG